MGLAQGAGADSDIPDSHFMDLLHDHVDHKVTFPEMVMESKRHAVPNAAFYQYLMDAFHQLAAAGVNDALCHGAVFLIGVPVKMVDSLKHLLACLP